MAFDCGILRKTALDRRAVPALPRRSTIFRYVRSRAPGGARRGRVDNWDLVDASAEFIIGEYLQGGPIDLLREVGKRVDRDLLTTFLDRHAARMPRTALSYATEQLTPAERERYRAL